MSSHQFTIRRDQFFSFYTIVNHSNASFNFKTIVKEIVKLYVKTFLNIFSKLFIGPNQILF